MPQNCPHRIRSRRLLSYNESKFEFRGEYYCLLTDVAIFGKECGHYDYISCTIPKLTKEELIEKQREMGQKELDGYV